MANNNLLQIDGYIIDNSKVIGRGQYGTVYECKSMNPGEENWNLCAKIIEVKDEKQAEREAQILNLIKNEYKFNPNIVQVHLVNYDKPGKLMRVVMEKCQTTLDDEQKNKFARNQVYTSEMLKDFLKQLLIGYLPLYINQIVHRDLKPENIMVNIGFSPIYKLIDFGVGKQKIDCSNVAMLTKAGTPAYAAPEISNFIQEDDTLNQDISQCQEFNSVDIYSIGIIMWQMMSGKLPYCKTSKTPSFPEVQEFCKILKTQGFPLNQIYNVDQELIELMKRMIVYYPSKRITFRELYQMFRIDVPNFKKQNSFSSSSTNFTDTVAFKQQFPFSNQNFLRNHVFRTPQQQIPQFKNNQPQQRIFTAFTPQNQQANQFTNSNQNQMIAWQPKGQQASKKFEQNNQFTFSVSQRINTNSPQIFKKLRDEIIVYLKFFIENENLMQPEKFKLIDQCYKELSELSLITLWALQIPIKKIKPEFVYCSKQIYSSHQMRFHYFLELVFSNQVIDENALQFQDQQMKQKLEEWSRAQNKQQQK